MNKSFLSLGVFFAALVVICWVYALGIAPTEENQGDAYRIMYVHVPSAFSAFSGALAIAIAGIWTMKSRTEHGLLLQRACAEVGLIFTVATLFTGSIWGRPTWGTWWTWDARLTTTLLLGFLFAGWMFLFFSLPSSDGRKTSCSVFSILIFVDVPIIYKSVTWWRTLHQPQSILRPGGSTMNSEIMIPLLVCVLIMVLFASWMIAARYRSLKTEGVIEELAMKGFSQ